MSNLLIKLLKPSKLIILLFLTTFVLFKSNAKTMDGNINSLSSEEWTITHAAHLLERAGFGGTPEEIDKIFKMGVNEATDYLVYYEKIPDNLKDFDESGIHDPGLINFPPSRPATTKLARENGEALGVKVKKSVSPPVKPLFLDVKVPAVN